VVRNGISVSEYGYDLNGNRTRSVLNGVEKVYLHDDQDRLLEVAGSAPEIPTAFEYTANGELFKKRDATGETTYQYDVFGSLKSVQQPDGTTIEYLTDPSHRRIGKRVNGIRVQAFVYQDSLKISAELDAANQIVSRFVYAGGINVPAYMVKAGVTYRLITDHLGSPRFVINTSNGTIAQQLDYDEFGNVILDTNPGFQPFGFAGGIYDSQTRLVRFGARDYDSKCGRWTAKDTLGFSAGINFYAYVGGDPLNWIDIDGLSKISVSGEGIWFTPIKGDEGHPHKYQGLDQGPHMHGPEGQKYFPQTNMILDKNGNWKSAGKKFKKKVNKALRCKLGKGLGSGGVLAIILMGAETASSANSPVYDELKEKMEQFAQSGDESLALDIAVIVKDLFGETSALKIWNDLICEDKGK